MKSLLTILLCFVAYTSLCQTADNYQLSAPLDLPTQGWNKVLMMRNGNTLLFHFEPRKSFTVKVFNKLHKEIASQKYLNREIGINVFEGSYLNGLYDISGEAVMFLQQQIDNRNSLVRLCFSADDGHLINQNVVMKSPSLGNGYYAWVLKNKKDAGYKIFYSCDITKYKDDSLMLVSYSDKHIPLDTVFVDVSRKDFEYVSLFDANMDKAGNVALTFLLRNTSIYSIHGPTVYAANGKTYDTYIGVCYLPKGSKSFFTTIAHAPADFSPEYEESSFNHFANNINLLFANGKAFFKRMGFNNVATIERRPLFLTISENDMSVKYKWLENDNLNKPFKRIDTSKKYVGIPLKMFTDENGLTTIIYQQYNTYYMQQNGYNVPSTYCGDIGIDQYDDNGNELWATVLPRGAQYLYHIYFANLLTDDGKFLFNMNPAEYYQNQFFSTGCYNSNKDYYLIYNDYPQNFNDSIGNLGPSLYKYDFSDAMYYKLGRQDSVSKHYLFGQPAKDESKCAFIESADFDDLTGNYATLVECRKGKNYTLCMGWCHLN